MWFWCAASHWLCMKVEHKGTKYECYFVIDDQEVTSTLLPSLKSSQHNGLVNIMIAGVDTPVNVVAALGYQCLEWTLCLL